MVKSEIKSIACTLKKEAGSFICTIEDFDINVNLERVISIDKYSDADNEIMGQDSILLKRSTTKNKNYNDIKLYFKE